jgi:hypothetical protein
MSASDGAADKSRPDPAGENPGEPLGEIRNGWGRLGKRLSLLSLIGLVLSAGPGVAIQHELQPYLSVLQIIWLTLPLTAAVAIIVVADRTESLTPTLAWFTIALTLVACALTGLSSGPAVSHFLFHPTQTCTQVLPDQGPLCTTTGYASYNPTGFFPLNVLLAYLHIYGWFGCIRSVLAGLFLGGSIYSLAVLMKQKTGRAGSPPAAR